MEASAHNPQEGQHTKRRLIWPWIVLGIIILLPLIALGWTGLWHIPVVSAVFGTSTPIDLGVETSPEALASAEADNPMTFTFAAEDFYGLAQRTYSGSVPIDDVHSSEELTSFIQHYTQKAPHVSDIQVKVREGGVEVSAFVKPYIKAPVYVDVDITRTSAKTVSLNLDKAKIGRLTVPERYYDDIAQYAEDRINEMLAEADGFSMETLEYRANGDAYLKGTLPETVGIVAGQDYELPGLNL